ncbi:MAG: hypothetical protein FD144_4229 [Rhodospirillaceae bacterium]|nr:MAG: hypothetical protein FD144_4229 [Rhodospirillaceae bacterium]
MSSITTRPATDDDVADLAPRLRQPDLDALAAAFPTLSAADALKLAKDRGECHVACLDGRLVGLFGITASPLRPTRGFPWFAMTAEALGSEATIADLLRLSARLVEDWQGRCPELVTMNDPRNAAYADWLKFLGFVAMGEAPTASGHPFTLHYREAPRAPSSSPLHPENS